MASASACGSTQAISPSPSGGSTTRAGAATGRRYEPAPPRGAAAVRRSALVQGCGRLSGAREVVLRFEQRRHRRPARADREARLHRRVGRDRDLASALLSLAEARRRLRHLRLPCRASRVRHDPGHAAVHRRGARARSSGDHGACRQPYLRQHPWFQHARRAKPGSAWRRFYVWADNDRGFADARIIFTDTEKSNWSFDPEAGAYFWHRFYSHQPDLNFDNPRVLQAVLGAMRFWLDLGVDGFRLDAVPYLVEREGTDCENLPETHAIIRRIRAALDRTAPGCMLLAEANEWPEDVQEYFGAGDECHMAFHFPLMPRMYMAIAQEDRFPVTDILRQTPEIPDACQWAIFLRNHDELTLEMVTDAERDYLWETYAADRRARLNLGIRRRLAPPLAACRASSSPIRAATTSQPCG